MLLASLTQRLATMHPIGVVLTATALTFAAVNCAECQAGPLDAGTRVRVKVLATKTGPVIGNVTSVTADTLVVDGSSSLAIPAQVYRLPIGRIASVETSDGIHGHALRDGLILGSIGAAAGTVIGAISGVAGDFGNAFCGDSASSFVSKCPDKATDKTGHGTIIGAIVGGVLGAGIGALYGAGDRSERWISVDSLKPAQLGFSPFMRAHRFGVAINF